MNRYDEHRAAGLLHPDDHQGRAEAWQQAASRERRQQSAADYAQTFADDAVFAAERDAREAKQRSAP